ncbi:unnamed protein product [Camellia sinensis]
MKAIAISKFDLEHRDLELFFRSVIFVFFDQRYKGTYCSQEVAIKVLKPDLVNKDMLREFAQEVFIMRSVVPECSKIFPVYLPEDCIEAVTSLDSSLSRKIRRTNPGLDSIGIVAISHGCTGVAARACGLVGLEPTRVAEILKDRPSNVPPAILLRFLREHRSEWADNSIDAYSAAAVKVGPCSLPGSRVGSFSGQVILPLAHTIEHEELFEVIKLEGVGHCPEDAIMPRDMFLLQLWSGMDENVVGTCAELIFAPIDASFADDAPLLPSGFRIIPLDSGKEASSPNRTLDLASALEIGPAGNKASNDYTSNGGSTRSVMTIAFEFAFELCYLGVELLKSGSEGSETTLKTLWHHTDAIMCCSLKALPVFTFANQAGLDMLETTLVALQDITLEKIFDDHGRKTLCSEFPQIMQQAKKKMVELVHKIIKAKRKNRGRSEVAKDIADVLLNDASEELNDYLISDVFNIISHII